MEKTRLNKFTVTYTNKQEYHLLKREIFTNNSYYFPNIKPKVIVDLGAHIGLSVLYFKQMYANSRVIAFEPNPYLFEILQENIFENNIQDVILQNKAVSNTSGKIPFYIDTSDDMWYSTGGVRKGSWLGVQNTKEISVESVTLSEILNIPVDILKMDIEGLEQRVIEETKRELKNVKNICIEYHPTQGNSFKSIIEILNGLDFKISLFKEGKEVKAYDKKGLVIIRGERA